MHGSEATYGSLKCGFHMAGKINLNCKYTVFVLVHLLQLFIKALASSNSFPVSSFQHKLGLIGFLGIQGY